MSETTDEAYGKATRRLWRQFKQGNLAAEQYKRESIAAFEQWKGAQQVSHEQEPHIAITKTPGGWKIEMDNDTWVLLMSALNGAISLEVKDGRGEGDQARQFRALLTALDRTDQTENF